MQKQKGIIKIYGRSGKRSFLVGEIRGDTLYRKIRGALYRPELAFSWDEPGLLAAKDQGATNVNAEFMTRHYICPVDEILEKGKQINFGNGQQLRFPVSAMRLVNQEKAERRPQP